VEVVASLSQGHTAAAQCGLFTHKSVPVIFEPPCVYIYVFIYGHIVYLNTTCSPLLQRIQLCWHSYNRKFRDIADGYDLYASPNFIRVIKSSTMRLTGQIADTGERRC